MNMSETSNLAVAAPYGPASGEFSGVHLGQIRARNSLLLAGAFTALIVPFAVIVGALLYRSRLHYQINYNEGWNSYFVQRILQGDPLYPDRSTQLINNYPPLSFYLAALLSQLTGSVLVAGRALAWFGYAASATLIGLNLRRMGSNATGAWFGALFFAACLATRFDLYVGMFDPQLVGQAVMLTGLLVLLSRQTVTGVAIAALLIVIGGFFKHNLVALPLTITFWLAWFRPRLFMPWLVSLLTLLAGGLVACAALFGPEFAAGLTVPRRMDLADGVRKVLHWLLPLELPCVLATLSLTLGGPYAALVGILLAVSLVVADIGSAAWATNYNMLFEMVVAVSFGLGLLVGRPSQRAPDGWVALAACGSLWVTALVLGTSVTTSWSAWSAQQSGRDNQAQADIAVIRATPGPVLCGTLLLCFEAGKPLVYDPLNYGQRPGENQSGLRQDIEAERFALIQTDMANLYFNTATLDAIRSNYREIPGHPGLQAPAH